MADESVDPGRARASRRAWALVIVVAMFASFALSALWLVPPPPDQAVFDVLERHGLISIDERDNIEYGSLSGEFVFEKAAITDDQYDALHSDLLALSAVTRSPSAWSHDWTFDGLEGLEPIRRINLIDGHYDRGKTKGQRILLVVVRWEGRRLNLWDRFRKWAHI